MTAPETMFDFFTADGRFLIISIDKLQNPHATFAARAENVQAGRGYELDLALEMVIEQAIAEAMECPRFKRA